MLVRPVLSYAQSISGFPGATKEAPRDQHEPVFCDEETFEAIAARTPNETQPLIDSRAKASERNHKDSYGAQWEICKSLDLTTNKHEHNCKFLHNKHKDQAQSKHLQATHSNHKAHTPQTQIDKHTYTQHTQRNAHKLTQTENTRTTNPNQFGGLVQGLQSVC